MRRACHPRPGIPGVLLGAGEGGRPAQLPGVPERNVQAGAPSVKGGHLRAVLREDLGKCPFTRAGGQAGLLEGAGALRTAATIRVSWAGLCHLSQGLRVCDFPTVSCWPAQAKPWAEEQNGARPQGRDRPGSAVVKMDAAVSAL